MKRVAIATALTVALFVPAVAQTMTDADCTAAWTRADTDKNGVLTEAESARYHAMLRMNGKTIADGRLNQATFLEHCKAGLFNAARPDPNAPLKGANSFTEAQAKDRVLAAGYTGVSALTKDGDGIWRGTAKEGASNVNVAVDFKGNVVTKGNAVTK